MTPITTTETLAATYENALTAAANFGGARSVRRYAGWHTAAVLVGERLFIIGREADHVSVLEVSGHRVLTSAALVTDDLGRVEIEWIAGDPSAVFSQFVYCIAR